MLLMRLQSTVTYNARRWWSVAVLIFLCFIILLLIKKQPTLTTGSMPTGRTVEMALTIQRLTEERDKASKQLNLLQVR